MGKKVAVFLCRCADNIASKVDVARLAEEIGEREDVAFVETHNLLCAADGQEFMAQALAQHADDVDRVVVAACSPKDHESTFQKVLGQRGMNPYLLQMANIREQCTWVTGDARNAYEKAAALTKAAIYRVRHHRELVRREVEINPDVVVVGGGMAGMEAALLAAQDGRRVTILEKAPSIGGMAVRIEEAAPTMECAPCMVSPRMSAIEEAENIAVRTNVDIAEVAGYMGNFRITGVQRPRMVNDACLACDECIQACPVEVVSQFDFGLGTRKAVDVPFPGCLPGLAVVDTAACLRTQGQECAACIEACPMDAMDFSQEPEPFVIEAGAVIVATGARPLSLQEAGGPDLPDVLTHAQFARLTSNHGPTGGQIHKADGTAPRRVVFVHCAGRDQLGYCSGYCCQAALGLGELARKQDIDAVHLVRDLVCSGEAASKLVHGGTVKHLPELDGLCASDGERIQLAGAAIERMDDGNVRVERRDGGMVVRFVQGGNDKAVAADMVVYVTGSVRDDGLDGVFDFLGVGRTAKGFLASDHGILRPTSSNLDGLLIAGSVRGGRLLSDAAADGRSAVGTALARLVPGKKMPVEAVVAATDEELCSACRTCLAVCPYAAVSIDEEKQVAVVNDVLCQGCGTCVAACPSGAADARHFTDVQIEAEIQGVLHG